METGGDGGCGEFSRPAEATNADPPGCGLDGSSQPFSGGDQFSAFEKAGLQPPAARGGQEDDSFCGDFRGPAATESNDALFQDVAYDNVPPQLDNNHESSQTFKDSDEDALGKPRETFGASAAVEPSGGEPQCTCGRVEGSGTLREDREGGHIGVHEEDEHDSFASAKDSGGFPFPAAEDSCRGGAAGGEYVLGDEGVFGTLAATSQRGEDRVRGEEKVEGNFGVFAMAAGRGQDPVRGDEGDFGAFAMTARGSEDPVGGDEGDFGAFLTTARGREGPLAGNEEDGVDFGAFATTTEEPGGGDVLGDEGGFGAFATKAHRGDDRVGCDEGDEGDFGAFRTTVGGGQDPLGGDKGNFGAFTATTGAGGGHVGCEEEVEGGLGAFAMTAGAGDDRVGGEEEDGVDFVAFATTKEGREHMFENHGGHGGFAATGQSGENHDGGEVEDEGDFGAFATSKEDLLEDEGDFGAFAMTGGEPVEANEEDGSDPGGCAANSKGDPRNVQGEGDGDNFEVSPSKSGAVAGASRGGESQGFGGFAMTDEADKAASDWGGNDDAGFGDFAEPGGDDGFGEFEDGGFTSAPPPATAPPPMAPPPPDHGDGILGKSGEVLLASLAKLLEPLGRVAGLEESAPEG